jgi:hypothetical protein
MRGLRRDLGRHLLDGRGVIEDPDGAAVRGENQVVVARVDQNLVDRHRRQVAEV